jgi:hypothetical protein
MKKTILVINLLFVGLLSFAQSGEFITYPNGLIYSDNTMSDLHHIVDSLNLKYKVCEANPQYTQLPKVKYHSIRFESSKDSLKMLMLDLENNLSLEKLEVKYRNISITENISSILNETTDKTGKEMIELLRFPGGYYLWHEVFEMEKPNDFDENMLKKWFVAAKKRTWSDDSDHQLSAIKIIEKPKFLNMPSEYAKMIQYGECLIDTTTSLFTAKARDNAYIDYKGEDESPRKNDINTVNRFFELFKKVKSAPNEYSYKEKLAKETKTVSYMIDDSVFEKSKYFKEFMTDLDNWKIQNEKDIKEIKANKDFNKFKNEAFKVSLEKGINCEKLADYMEKIGNKNAELALRRNYIKIGGCSQDQSPRYHLQNIASLSAETANWESFLKAHLDVMNDRVQRVSDGSYAWGRRNTYIKELEELGLDIPKLIIGSCLRFHKPVKHHYFGNVSRVGRALSETKYSEEVESLLLKMIQDANLDDFNRYICYYIYKNYTFNIQDKDKQKLCSTKLEKATITMPDYIKDALKNNDKD